MLCGFQPLALVGTSRCNLIELHSAVYRKRHLIATLLAGTVRSCSSTRPYNEGWVVILAQL